MLNERISGRGAKWTTILLTEFRLTLKAADKESEKTEGDLNGEGNDIQRPQQTCCLD